MTENAALPARLVVVLDGIRVDSLIHEPNAEKVAKHAAYVARSLAEGWRFNMQGGRYKPAPESEATS